MRKAMALAGALALGATPVTWAGQTQVAQNRQAEATKVCTVKVTGMTCGGCEAAVKMAAKQIDGVKSATASYEKGLAEVTYDPAKTTPHAIAKGIAEKTGYKAEAQESKK
jgi:copper chaperone